MLERFCWNAEIEKQKNHFIWQLGWFYFTTGTRQLLRVYDRDGCLALDGR